MRVTARRGFSLVEVVIVLGVVVLLVGLGVVGWRALNASSTTQRASVEPSLQSAEVITTKADLDAAAKALDDLDFDDDESADEAELQANL